MTLLLTHRLQLLLLLLEWLLFPVLHEDPYNKKHIKIRSDPSPEVSHPLSSVKLSHTRACGVCVCELERE